MTQETIDLAKYRLEKAKTTYNDAKQYFKSVSLEATVNRIYYAMFYTVNSLLIISNLSSAKHTGVRALFNKEFVKTNVIDKEDGKFYAKMFDNRQEGDYKDFVQFNKDEVKEWLNKAEDFINTIEKIVLNKIKQIK